MRSALVIGVLLLAGPQALAQSSLPDLGGPGDAALSPHFERRIGESIVREIRFREASYIDDPEIADYLANLGARLTRVMSGTRYDFDFFVMRDSSINAFALPGGFVGVHTGLVTAAESESELASVISHEIAHVTQRHIVRMIGQQQRMDIPLMVAMAAAILLGRSRPDLAQGAAAAAQTQAINTQLAFSRDFEREADRVGLQALSDAGFDSRAMASFFEKMQRATRVMDDSAVPGYLRSHPVTFERIADSQNKAAAMPYRQHLDSAEFHLVRAKVRAEAGEPRDALAHFEGVVREKRYASESAARYGLAAALLRAKRPKDAQAELARSRAAGGAGPMIETLDARVRQALGDREGAASLLAAARAKYPHARPLLYAQAEALHEVGRNDQAIAILADASRQYPGDARLHGLKAKTYAALGKRLLQHQSQAEYYALQGSLPAAIEQLQLARSAGDGDFYQLSIVEARLKDLRAQHRLEVDSQKR
jgi:predicted Zn-dependent protease